MTEPGWMDVPWFPVDRVVSDGSEAGGGGRAARGPALGGCSRGQMIGSLGPKHVDSETQWQKASKLGGSPRPNPHML